MTQHKSEDIYVNNERSLRQLAWAIEASVGQFKLILARCNYASSRSHFIEQLREICQVEIRVLILKESDRTLYTAIREEFRDDVQALMILGLESVRNLDQMLISANQVREEFRNHFPFPMVVWIDDEVHKILMQFAPDLESWATTKSFTIAADELMEFLQETAEQLLNGDFSLALEKSAEIKLAWQDLQNYKQVLEPEVKARIECLLGFTEYVDKNFDQALEYYQQSLAFWQQVNDLVWQGKVLSYITLCYYEKARQQESDRLQAVETRHPDTVETRHPDNVETRHPDNVETRHPDNVETRHPDTVETRHPDNVETRHPDNVETRHGASLQRDNTGNLDWQETRNYLQQTLQVLEAAQRRDLIANLLDKFGIILRDLQDWEQLKTLAEQALPVHESEGDLLKISQDYGFLAEVELANQKWQDAKKLAEKALEANSSHTKSLELYKQSLAVQANESAQLARSAYSHRQEFLLILAQAEQNLGREEEAINHLEVARKIGISDYNPQLFINILRKLRRLYLKQKQYLAAFKIKQERLSIEQQFGLRAFIGAGRLQATRQGNFSPIVETRHGTSPQDIAPEISASGRLLDVERLISRIGRHDHKLIVIYGYSGVGKSSLVNAGLVPALKNKAIGIQDNLVVVVRVYTNWVEELGWQIVEALRETGRWIDDTQTSASNTHAPVSDTQRRVSNTQRRVSNTQRRVSNTQRRVSNTQRRVSNTQRRVSNTQRRVSNTQRRVSNTQRRVSEPQRRVSNTQRRVSNTQRRVSEPQTPHSPTALLEKLRQCETQNLRPVLIFDQFEEFFFVDIAPQQRRQFFEFVGECLNILSVKVILSLRVDYLHYLLECNDLPTMKIIGNDILSNHVLYKLGNFSPIDAKSIIEQLTERANFHLEPALIGELVEDLARELGEVRPIELQVVGAQLQTEDITTLAKYRECGTKAELVKRYLNAVVEDCGEENQQTAEFVLYLLTDEKGTRPLKTRAELERDLQALAADVMREASKLDLILEIFVESGLVVLLRETPANRYQLVHDYLAAFIRQQQEPKLTELMAELEKERKQRKLSEQKLNRFLKIALTSSVAAVFAFAFLAWQADTQRKKSAIDEIRTLINSSEAFFASGKTLDALVEALKARGKLKDANWATADIRTLTMLALQQAVYLQPQEYSFRERNRRHGHSNFVRSVTFSPDGKTLATSSDDKTIKLWDAATSKLLKTLSGHSNAVTSVVFSPDGKTLATGSDDNTIKLWNVGTGKPLKTLSGHRSFVTSVVFSPDGKTLATGSDDKTIKLWDVATSKLLKSLIRHSHSIRSVVFSPDGRILATGSDDNTIKLWDVATSKLLKTLSEHSNSVTSVVFSPDGKTLATGSDDNTIKLWDVATSKPLKTLSEHSNSVLSVVFSPDGKTLATGSDDNTIKLWDVATGKPLKTLNGHNSSVVSVAFSPDGKILATGSDDNTIRVWNLIKDQQFKTLSGHSSFVNSIVFSPDGKTLAIGSGDSNIRLWSVVKEKQLKTLSGHSSFVTSVMFSPDGKTLATGSGDNTIKLWDVATGKLLQTLSGHSSFVTSVMFSPDGKTLATGSDDNTIKLWDVATGKPLQTLSGHSRSIRSVVFSPDGKTLAAGSDNKTIKLWDMATGKPLQTLSGHSSSVLSVVFSPNGKTLATGSYDKTIKFWDVATAKQFKTLSGHGSFVRSVVFSPDGKTLATGSGDNTIKLWDVATGKPLKTLRGHSSFVNSVVFSPDGKTLATGSADTKVALWNFDLDNLVRDGCNWLNSYLATHTDVLEELKECQTKSILMQAAPSLVARGGELARNGDIDAAVDKFRKAQTWNPRLKFDPQTKAQEFANKRKAESLVAQGESLVNEGKVKEAITAYTNAQKLDPKVEIDADSWNSLCWDGSLHRHAADVMFACEKAVQLAPYNGGIRDSRGLARALTRNTQGAIEDFEAFIAQVDDKETISQRQRWVKDLRAGKNPFTDEELKNLLGQ
jgi:WD40 repeat protein/tetratricopeptide (TPR) repeat protein